jgi:hypothetical protein
VGYRFIHNHPHLSLNQGSKWPQLPPLPEIHPLCDAIFAGAPGELSGAGPAEFAGDPRAHDPQSAPHQLAALAQLARLPLPGQRLRRRLEPGEPRRPHRQPPAAPQVAHAPPPRALVAQALAQRHGRLLRLRRYAKLGVQFQPLI